MASYRSSVSLPPSVVDVLSLRGSTSLLVPDEVRRALAALPYFRAREFTPPPSHHHGGGGGRPQPAHGGGGGGSRFGSLASPSLRQAATNTWRTDSPSSDDGFQTVTRGGGGGHNHNQNRRRPYHSSGSLASSHSSTPSGTPMRTSHSDSSFKTVPPVNTLADEKERFTSAAAKGADVEDRILARVKGKINKLGSSTYDSTKSFMQEILSGDETDFLEEFMKFVFQKAATEPTFCAMYARLLHELADEFGHLRIVMIRLFRDYINIFREVEISPPADPSTSDYRTFVEAQERKKFRRGYSQFVTELTKIGEADQEDFQRIVLSSMDMLESLHVNPEKNLLCEEYIDCMSNLCVNAPEILVRASWSVGLLERLEVLSKKKRDVALGLTNKARFALMDIVDLGKRGWRK